MNKSDLIERLGSETGLSLTEADKFVTLVFSEMSEALAKGERIEIRGIGSFKIKHYEGYTGVNPKTMNNPAASCGVSLEETETTL